MELRRNSVEAKSDSLTAERKEMLTSAQKGQSERYEQLEIKMREQATQLTTTDFWKTYV
jgi:hypothetical protein